jgi:integrase
MKAEWQRSANAETITQERAAELCATWAAWIAAGAPLDRGGETSDVFEPAEVAPENAAERRAKAWARVDFHSQEALRLVGISATADSMDVLRTKMIGPVAAAYLSADRKEQIAQELAEADLIGRIARARGDLVKVALPQVAQTAPPSPKLSFDDMWQKWKLATNTKARTVHETRGMLHQLEEFLGHSDTARVAKQDLINWREKLRKEGLSPNTWNNKLSLIGQPFKRAVKDGALSVDPTEGLRLEKAKSKSWLPYDDGDAVAILSAARKETKSSLRWSHWVMAFTGARVGEVLQLTADDIQKDDKSGIWFMAIREEAARGKSVKNSQPRNVPIHPALEKEGFLAYVQSVQKDTPQGPLFPDKKADRYGNRGGRAWNVVGDWVRKTVGILDDSKAPNHSWRHRFEDQLRDEEVVESDRDAIVGHARKTTGRIYGLKGESLKRLHRELSRVKLPKGL